MCKDLVVVPTIILCLNGSAIGMQSFVALFQTDIVGSQSAKSDVWIEFNKNITTIFSVERSSENSSLFKLIVF